MDKRRDNGRKEARLRVGQLVCDTKGESPMNLVSRFFGPKYQDEQLVFHAQNAIAVDPLLQDPAALIVTSAKGVVKLTGPVHRAQEKERIEGVVR